MSNSLTGFWTGGRDGEMWCPSFPWDISLSCARGDVCHTHSWVHTSPPQLSLMMSRVSQLRTDRHSPAACREGGSTGPSRRFGFCLDKKTKFLNLLAVGEGTERLQKVRALQNMSGRTGRESLQLLHHAASVII